MDHTLNYDNLAPEAAHLVKSLMGPHDSTRNQEAEHDSFDWTASKDFRVEDGQRQIREYIKTWALPSSWLFSLDYLGETKEQSHLFYQYRARFSTPTARSPIMGTASVYFIVNKVKPDTQPVDVHYVVESNRLVHRAAGREVLREKWLVDVIESKIRLRKRLQDCWNETNPQTAAAAAGAKASARRRKT